jgi:molybdenum cofactor cytidylyltransferase
MSKTGAIILAAGNSSRLGRPKQLLPYRGKTLLAHIATEALNADLHPVVVVTGAYQAEVADDLRSRLGASSRDQPADASRGQPADTPPGQPLEIIFNPAWQEGMASGIVAGVSKIISLHPEVEAVIIAVCDQPFISAALLSQLVATHDTSKKGIVACTYADSVGTPVLFRHPYFEQLLLLSGSEGAKKIIKQHPADLATIPFPDGHIDIDTGEDVQKLRQSDDRSTS